MPPWACRREPEPEAPRDVRRGAITPVNVAGHFGLVQSIGPQVVDWLNSVRDAH